MREPSADGIAVGRPKSREDSSMCLRRSLALITALALVVLPNREIPAHEGHDHAQPKGGVAFAALPRATASSEAFELVAIASAGEIIIYLDRFASNVPVPDAQLVLESPDGSLEAKAAEDGTYRLAAPFTARPGRYDFIATVTKADDTDVLPFTIEIPPAPDPAKAPAASNAAWALGMKDWILAGGFGALLVLIGAFTLGAFAGMLLVRRRPIHALIAIAVLQTFAHSAFSHEGEDHAPTPAPQSAARDVAQLLPDGSVFVPKSMQRVLALRTMIAQPAAYRRSVELPGRIIPDPNASGFVQATVAGRLSPPEGGFPRLGTQVKKGDVLAYVTPPLQAIDVSDMRQRQGELEQQISIIERRLARYETLVSSGAVARTQLEETKLELQGLKERRAALDRIRREPDVLHAPVDGVIADGTPVAGQVIQTNAVVFHIIDPTRLWIEALSYESLPSLRAGTARAGDKDLKLTFRGAGFADRNQSIPIHFAIEGDASSLRVGQFVTVFAETPEEQRGLAVPRTSIVRTTAGQDTVYEHVAAERFEQRPVRIEPLDAQRVLISQGLPAGKRVVVQGAELIAHIR